MRIVILIRNRNSIHELIEGTSTFLSPLISHYIETVKSVHRLRRIVPKPNDAGTRRIMLLHPNSRIPRPLEVISREVLIQ